MDGQPGFLGCSAPPPSTAFSLSLSPTSHLGVRVWVPRPWVGRGPRHPSSPSPPPAGAWVMLSPQTHCRGGGRERWGPPPSPRMGRRAGTLRPGRGARAASPFPWACARSGCFSPEPTPGPRHIPNPPGPGDRGGGHSGASRDLCP